jgi:UDP-2,3-diacylglucosamine hydrolase
MKISSISDIHIYEDNDERSLLLYKFLKSKEVCESTHIVLLGDIFDLMVGNKKEYLQKYEQTFSRIKKASKNKELIYISGNHDFSLSKILNEYFNDIKFQYSSKPVVLNDSNTSIYLSHGDEVDENELSYQRWKNIYSNKYFQKIIDIFLPYFLIDMIGSNASKKSKKRNIKKFDYKLARNKYSNDLRIFLSKHKADYFILGHTHIEYLDKKIVNNGFVPIHKKFAHYNGESLSLVTLG